MRPPNRTVHRAAAAQGPSDLCPPSYTASHSPRRSVTRAFGGEGQHIAMHPATAKYNESLSPSDRGTCSLLALHIRKALPEAENKIWHCHPVWFLEGDPVVGYDKLKDCVRLLFWSGQAFEEAGLRPEGRFKAAEARFSSAEEVDTARLQRWLAQARDVQWDYKNLVKRKGRLERLK